jgi:glycosyl transferase family 87
MWDLTTETRRHGGRIRVSCTAKQAAEGMMISRMWTGTLLSRLSSGLTERRLRVHGLLLAICLWSIYAFDLSTPGLLDRHGLVKGTDFVHFYVLGSLALQHHGSALYNTLFQTAIAQQIVPGAQPLYFVALYGPQVSLLFEPFARLPYGWGLIAWSLVSAALYGICCWAIRKTCPRLKQRRATIIILATAYPAFFHLIAWGQTSAPALACFTLAYLALRSKRQFLAGLAIGLLIYKPQLGFVAVLLFLFSGQWNAVGGALISAAAELSIGWIYYGTGVMRDYAEAVWHLQKVLPYLEPRPYTVHSLRAFWSMLIPVPALATLLYVVSAGVVLVVTTAVWRSKSVLSLRFSAMLLATVLIAPHLTVYDLVVLAPAFLLLADWRLSENIASSSLPLLLYLCYALPLIGPLAGYTHVQVSVLAFVGLIYFLWHVTVRQGRSQVAVP